MHILMIEDDLDLGHALLQALKTEGIQAGAVWTFGELQIEPKRHEARLGGEPLDLSPREFRLLLEWWCASIRLAGPS